MNFKFEGSPVANKFRAAAKKAIAANRVRDSPKVSQPSGKQLIGDFFEEPLPTRTLHEVFLDAADENEQMSFSTMCQLVEPCNLSTLDMSQWKVKFQHHHPEGVKADWMTFRLALGELATQMGVSFDHIVGQIICAPTTFMVNEMTAKQVAAVYGTYCDETGRIKPASFLRMLRHCRILDGDQKQDLGDARHLDIAVADSIFRSQASDAKDRGLTYLQFTKAILAIADFVGVPHLRISQNVAGRAKVLSMSSTPMKYVVPKRQVDNALFYTTNMAKAAPAA